MSYSKQEAYNGIKELVEKFKNNYSQFHSSEYNETLTRQDFINPFFEFLGWDISNKQGYSQSYREVIHEDKIKTVKRQAPDYSFRIGGNRVFFVEAKKPSRNLKEDSEAAYQIRRYAWSGKLGISILTDFEEFAIYDCSKKPSPNDKASMSRIEYINYEDYLERFDFLYDTFAKESVLKGSLEKYNADAKSKRGTESVDIDFLNSLDNLRTKLASNISKLNNNLSERDLNFAVQHIIDRIIFLRVAEDRGVENYGDLRDACDKQGAETSCYKNIVEIFKKADGKYNSGLFDFSYDKITANIEAENKIVKEIINDLYYPKSPYEFSIIPIEIIGKAYEQFLGKTITIGNNHKAKIELKPEVRKAGGVYYTPEYIVDYIVENTVGEKIKGLTPEKIEKIKIVDPACGSGSFLLGAYKYLLNYHREYYLKSSDKKLKGYKENKRENARENIIKENGELALWIKKKILRNNIFGVDIDSNAVEVTKLSLLLKCMEGETSASIMDNQSLFNERALPSLDDNIKCGNSLIGSDFYSNQNMLNIDMETQYKINSFDWEKEFVEAFKKGGFDVVIGNPPYEITLGKRTKKERYILENENEYYKNEYINIQGEINLYKVFAEKMTKLINKYGAVGVIMPTGILTDKSNLNLRNYILDNFSYLQINHFPEKAKVFKNVTQDVSVYIISNNNNLITLKNNLMNDYELNYTKPIAIPKKIINRLEKVPLINDKKEIVLLNKLCNYKTFNETKLVSFIEGEIHLTKFKEAIKRNKTSKNTFDLVRGDSVRRYLFIKSDKDSFIDGSIVKKISSSPKLNDINSIRLIYQHITNIQMNRRLIFQLLNTKKYISNSCGYVINKSDYNIKYFLALLNSKLLNWRYKVTSSNNNILTNELYNLPVPILYLSKKSDREIHDKLVNLVENIINLNKKLANENNPNTTTILKRQIAAIDDEIDKIVYKLYGLTKEEIRIVEGE